jgi:hypothetical protein
MARREHQRCNSRFVRLFGDKNHAEDGREDPRIDHAAP